MAGVRSNVENNATKAASQQLLTGSIEGHILIAIDSLEIATVHEMTSEMSGG